MDLVAVMDRAGVNPKYAVGQEGWTTIKCASKRAYGCGKVGNSAVQDLDLLLRRGDVSNQSASFSVRAGDKVFRRIDQEIAAKGSMPPVVRPGDDQKDRYFTSNVEIVDKGLIVVTLCFSKHGGFDYYLVFDSVDSSLSLIPYIPKWATSYTRSPLPLRHDGGYSLLLLAHKSGYGREMEGHSLWQWSPSFSGSSGGRSSNPWQSSNLCLPAEMKGWFTPDVLFSSNGFAFWTDLALGTLCCDCSALLSGRNPVNFTFIELPPGYQTDRFSWSAWAYRTMACVGGSLKFVSIDKPDCCYNARATSVKVWTMAPWSSRLREWKLYSERRMKHLWKDFKRAGLPKDLPMWPMLREQEGSTLYMILDETKTRDGHHICQLDMPTMSLLQSKLLDGRSFQGTVILPSDFFEHLDSLPCVLEQNLDGRLTKRRHIGQGC